MIMDRAAYQKQVKRERKSTHKRIEIQLTLKEYQAFKRAAEREGTSVNLLVKNMAVAYRDTQHFVPHELKQSLYSLAKLIRNIADNINQMSHSANLFKDVDEKRVFQHLAQLDKEVRDFVKNKTG